MTNEIMEDLTKKVLNDSMNSLSRATKLAAIAGIHPHIMSSYVLARLATHCMGKAMAIISQVGREDAETLRGVFKSYLDEYDLDEEIISMHESIAEGRRERAG